MFVYPSLIETFIVTVSFYRSHHYRLSPSSFRLDHSGAAASPVDHSLLRSPGGGRPAPRLVCFLRVVLPEAGDLSFSIRRRDVEIVASFLWMKAAIRMAGIPAMASAEDRPSHSP